jgi:hypothetical protein
MGTIEWMNPTLFSIKANTEDNPMWNEPIGVPNTKDYWQACKKEPMYAWEVVEQKSWINVIPSTWAFKCKTLEPICFGAQGIVKSKESTSSRLTHLSLTGR